MNISANINNMIHNPQASLTLQFNAHSKKVSWPTKDKGKETA